MSATPIATIKSDKPSADPRHAPIRKFWFDDDDTPTRTLAEERRHRQERLAGAFRLFARNGFDQGLAGHITARDPECSDHFWLNPFGLHFGRLRVSDLLLVNRHGEIVVGAGPVNQAAFAIHAAIHEARPDVVAAAHTHSLYGKAWSTLGRTLAPLTQDSCAFYENHSLFGDFRGVVLDTGEGARIADALGAHKGVILKNHGILTAGPSVEAGCMVVHRAGQCVPRATARRSRGQSTTYRPRHRHAHTYAGRAPLRRAPRVREPLCGADRTRTGVARLMTIHKLRRFVGTIAALVDEAPRESELIEHGLEALRDLVREDDWLPDAYAVPSPERYQQYLLYADARQRFSVVSFVWGPGQQTPVHDHTVWGLIGVLRGAEYAQPYVRDAAGALHAHGAEVRLRRGDVEAVSPAIGDIHRVRNAYDDQVSISIHVYGANIGAVRRSTYPHDAPPKPFISGYSNDFLPNLWDLSKEPAAS